MKIYSCIFFDNGLHMTWHYSPGECELPNDVKEGDSVDILITGGLFRSDIGFLTCERVGRSDLIRECYPTDKQPSSGIPLHITLYHAGYVSPVQSGLLLKYMTQKQRDILLFPKDEQYKWKGWWSIKRDNKNE